VNHVIWRLHRNQARFAAIAFAITAVVIVLSGFRMANTYHAALLEPCSPTSSCVPNLQSELFRGDGLITDIVSLSTLTLPGLLGLFWGVPLVAKELEEGTHVLAWTQGVTRRRWIATNLGWVLLAAAIFGAAMSALVTWWRIPENTLYGRLGNFDIQGLVPVAYCLFAVALGVAAGVLFRRVLPALAATLGVLVALRTSIAIYLRPRYMTPVRVPFNSHGYTKGQPTNALLVSNPVVDAAGRNVTTDVTGIPTACQHALGSQGLLRHCMTAHGYRKFTAFQPDSRFWTFQAIESAIFLALAIPLVIFTYRRVVGRDA
jgi:hypothetical protein